MVPDTTYDAEKAFEKACKEVPILFGKAISSMVAPKTSYRAGFLMGYKYAIQRNAL